MTPNQPSGAQDANTTERGAYTLDVAVSGVVESANPRGDSEHFPKSVNAAR